MRILASTLAIFHVLCAVAQAPPNDNCDTATLITCGEVINGSTAEAEPDEAFECGTGISAPGIWYELPGMNAAITVSTCTLNSYDTKINVYSGSCGTITCVGGNDDGPGCNLGSSVSFVGNGGTTYYILVQGYNGAVGSFELTVECEVIENDDCSGAIPLTCGESVEGTTLGAFPDEAFDCGTSITAPGVWYTVSGIGGLATVTTCSGFSYDTKINVYSGVCGVITCVGGNDDTPGQGLCSTVNWFADPAETYQVLVQGFNNAVGSFTLELSCNTCPDPTNVSVTALDTVATVSWDSFNDGALYELEYGPSGFAPGEGTSIAGIVGADGPPVTIGGLTLDTVYEVYLLETCESEAGALLGPFEFTTPPFLIAPNALCENAASISCGEALSGNTVTGLPASGPTCGSANITTKGLWYTFTGSGEVISLSTCGQTNYDSKISVFAGFCGTLVCVAGNDDSPGCGNNSSQLSFPSTLDVEYLVLVHGYNQAQGLFTLTMGCAPSCSPIAANDDCGDATILIVNGPGGCESVTGSNACAFAPAFPNPPCIPFAPIVDVWYRFNTQNASEVEILLQATSAGVLHAALYSSCSNDPYIACWTDVTETILVNGLEPGMDHFLRVWNAGGGQAGEFTVCVEGDITTGLEHDPMMSGVSLRPVPTTDLLTIDGWSGTAKWDVIDGQGRIVQSGSAIDNGPHTVSVSGLAPGVYTLRNALDGIAVGRFVKE